jgi:hypothetical protein
MKKNKNVSAVKTDLRNRKMAEIAYVYLINPGFQT